MPSITPRRRSRGAIPPVPAVTDTPAAWAGAFPGPDADGAQTDLEAHIAGLDAAPPAPPAAAAGAPPAAAVWIPFADTYPSPLNPRRVFRPDKLEELRTSIAAQGLLQPLTGRRDDEGRVEVYIGGSRWRALQALADGDWPESHLPGRRVPVVLRDVSDLELLQVAVAENIERDDMHPLDEGEAFAAMVDRDPDLTPARIAALYGKTARWVQERIRVARNLAPAAGAAFREGNLEFAQAKTLSRYPRSGQDALLLQHTDLCGWSSAYLDQQLRQAHPRRSDALFPLERYAGGWIEPEEPGGEARFEDVAEFLRWQELAILERVAALRASNGWVEQRDLTEGDWHWSPLGFNKGYRTATEEDPAEAVGTVVVVSPARWPIRIYERLVKEAPKPPASPKAEDPVAAIGPKRLALAAQGRTAALQAAAFDHPNMPLARLALALLGSTNGVRIAVDLEWPTTAALAPAVAEPLDRYRRLLGEELFDVEGSVESPRAAAGARLLRLRVYGRPYQYRADEMAAVELLPRLLALRAPQLAEFVSALSAARLRTGSEMQPGDDPLSAATAETTSCWSGATWRMDAAYLGQLRADDLRGLAIKIDLWGSMRRVPPLDRDALRAAKTVGALRALLLAHIEEHDIRLTPPELEFGTLPEVEERVRAWHAGQAPTAADAARGLADEAGGNEAGDQQVPEAAE